MPSNLSTSTSCEYGDVRMVEMPFDDAVTRIEGALKKEGFGVLCQIDIRANRKEKLGSTSHDMSSSEPATRPSRSKLFNGTSTWDFCRRATLWSTNKTAKSMLAPLMR